MIELLTVLPMLAIVLLGIYALSDVGAKSQRRASARTASLERGQNGIERLTREMRQATDFTPVSSQILDATTYVRPSDGGASVAAAGPLRVPRRRLPALGGTGRRDARHGPGDRDRRSRRTRTSSSSRPNSVNPTFVSMKVEVGVNGANNPIVLDGGFELRNLEAQ